MRWYFFNYYVYSCSGFHWATKDGHYWIFLFQYLRGPLLAVIIYMVAGGIGKAFLSGMKRMRIVAVRDTWNIVRPMIIYALPLIPNNHFLVAKYRN